MRLSELLLEQNIPSTLYHGTKSKQLANSQQFGREPVYLTANKQQAAYYAAGAHLGGTTGEQMFVLTVKLTPGKTLQADHIIEQIIMDEHEEFEDIDQFVEYHSKHKEYDYIIFSHPDVGEDGEHLAVVSLQPQSDLSIVNVETIKG